MSLADKQQWLKNTIPLKNEFHPSGFIRGTRTKIYGKWCRTTRNFGGKFDFSVSELKLDFKTCSDRFTPQRINRESHRYPCNETVALSHMSHHQVGLSSQFTTHYMGYAE